MANSKQWKSIERTVARRLRMTRTPLSGRSGGAGTSGDAYADLDSPRSRLYVEIKHYARMAIFSLYADTLGKARKEGREPIVVCHEKGSARYLAVLDLDTLCYLLDVSPRYGTGEE